MKKFIPPILALLVWGGVLWWWTAGFRAFTVFSYALHEAGTLPREFPAVALMDQDGKDWRLENKKKFVLVNFVYLDCPDVCHKINNRLEGIYRELAGGIVPEDLEMLTVSFDLEHDDVRKLGLYKKLFGEGLEGWTFAMPEGIRQEEFEQFLASVGVWARRVPKTNLINHSVYQFLVAPDGRIVRVFDPARMSDEEVVGELNSWVQN